MALLTFDVSGATPLTPVADPRRRKSSCTTVAPGSVPWMDAELRRLLAFGTRVVHPDGGAAWLDDDGAPLLDLPRHTYVTARMAHVYGLGVLLGVDGAREIAVALLASLHAAARPDGWAPTTDDDGTRAAYDHTFVVLAASTAVIAGLDDALLPTALAALDRFWAPGPAMYTDRFDGGVLDPYRGANANMHAVEALLAAADATGEQRHRERALAIATTAIDVHARAYGWRIPEHFTPAWEPRPDYHRDQPDHPFQPYGATVGHAVEWSRLLLHLDAALGPEAPGWVRPASTGLYDRAVADGWAVDGADGFVYTTDWNGTPVVHDRMHWVAAEAVAAAAVLHRVTGEARFATDVDRFWAWTDRHLIDREHGSWHHQLDRRNVPSSSVWSGKPDLYHAVQATLLPRLPAAPGLALALRDDPLVRPGLTT